jgi:LysR family transcriptional regulator, low CO2-responsive transcriptional regulator
MRWFNPIVAIICIEFFYDSEGQTTMDTEQLAAFERIVREGGFSRAARTLDIAQPTISARMQALEREVGGPLFVRGGRRLALTELGEAFLPYARRTLEVLAEGVEAGRLAQSGQGGRVTVGAIQSLSGGFLATAVARFCREHPSVEVFVRTGHSEQVMAMLDDGVVRLGLLAWPALGAELTPLLRFREPLVLIVPAGHPLAGRGTVLLEDVWRESRPFLLIRWGPALTPLLARLADQDRPIVELPLETVRALLARGVGTAFLTRTLVEEEIERGRLAEVPVSDLPPMYREGALARLARGGPLPAAADDFVEAVRLAAAGIREPP